MNADANLHHQNCGMPMTCGPLTTIFANLVAKMVVAVFLTLVIVGAARAGQDCGPMTAATATGAPSTETANSLPAFSFDPLRGRRPA
ncbi:hypothetical protein FHW64_003039 [Variovorax sp. Sphag1AA]|nr:hypothetical protein [Variovorax sp. Sphag1AA]